MTKFISISLTNAAEGRDDDYNAWCNNQHIGDVLAVPGIKAAQRFRLSDQISAKLGFRYLSLYEMEAEQISDVHAAIAARAGTALMPRTDSSSPDRLFLELEPLSARITAEESAATRGSLLLD
ncbi:hypothetical protein ACXX82_19775 [Glaciimonas sp. GNP009]